MVWFTPCMQQQPSMPTFSCTFTFSSTCHRKKCFFWLERESSVGSYSTSSFLFQVWYKIVATSTANTLNSVGRQMFSPQQNFGPNLNFLQAFKGSNDVDEKVRVPSDTTRNLLMWTSWSHGHATHNQDWDLIPESRNRSDRSVTKWKPAPRHQHYWIE